MHAPDRAAALARLRRALDDYAVLGVTTNLPLLRAIAAHPDFAAGATHTDFLATSGLAGARFEPPITPPEALIAAAIFDIQALSEGLAYRRPRPMGRRPLAADAGWPAPALQLDADRLSTDRQPRRGSLAHHGSARRAAWSVWWP